MLWSGWMNKPRRHGDTEEIPNSKLSVLNWYFSVPPCLRVSVSPCLRVAVPPWFDRLVGDNATRGLEGRR
jgi:hypothetical protein